MRLTRVQRLVCAPLVDAALASPRDVTQEDISDLLGVLFVRTRRHKHHARVRGCVAKQVHQLGYSHGVSNPLSLRQSVPYWPQRLNRA
jgi:hypothetical protein